MDSCHCSVMLLHSYLVHFLLNTDTAIIFVSSSLFRLAWCSEWSDMRIIMSPHFFLAAWHTSFVESQIAAMPPWRHSILDFVAIEQTVLVITWQSQIYWIGSTSVATATPRTIASSSVSRDVMVHCKVEVNILSNHDQRLLCLHPSSLFTLFFVDYRVVCEIQLGSLCAFCKNPCVRNSVLWFRFLPEWPLL